MTVIIDVINDSDQQIPAVEELQSWSDIAISHLEPSSKPMSLGIRVVDEQESAAINLAYRQKDYATNVLSFGADLPDAVISTLDEVPLGDLVICAQVVAREASEQNKTLNAHWAHMLIHGILHLHGFDHETDDEAADMEALETRILQQLGFDKPYQSETSYPHGI